MRVPASAVSAVAGVALLAAGCARDDGAGTRAVTAPTSDRAPQVTDGRITEAQLRRFDRFPVYGLGARFRGLDRSHILRRGEVDPLPGVRTPPRRDEVGMLYGTCAFGDGPEPERRCTDLVEVQTRRECGPQQGVGERAFRPRRMLTIRGTVAAWYAAGTLEVYTGRVTVRIFAGTRAAAEEAARALEGANAIAAGVLMGTDLPDPDPGAPTTRGVLCRAGAG
jgi:hypothetical protein